MSPTALIETDAVNTSGFIEDPLANVNSADIREHIETTTKVTKEEILIQRQENQSKFGSNSVKESVESFRDPRTYKPL